LRILIISTVMPHRMRLGGEVVTQNFVDAILGLGHTCDLVAYRHHGDDSPLPANFHSAGGWHIETELSGMRPYFWLARALLTAQPYLCTKFQSRRLLRTVHALTHKQHYDCILLDHTNLGWLLDRLRFAGPVIFVAHNLESALYAAEAAGKSRYGFVKRAVFAREAAALARMERHLARKCRQIWTLTDEERQAYAALVDDPHGVRAFDIPGKALPAPSTGAAPPRVDVGLLGGWLWNVNRAGLEWFMRDVVPRLPPSLTIEIAGKGAHLVGNPFPNVTYRGFVDNALDFLRSCRVTVVPSVSGAGVQVKTIEGIGAGVPMVSTAIGLRGIRALPAYVASATGADELVRLIASRVREPLAHDYAGGAQWAQERQRAFRAQIESALAAAVAA